LIKKGVFDMGDMRSVNSSNMKKRRGEISKKKVGKKNFCDNKKSFNTNCLKEGKRYTVQKSNIHHFQKNKMKA
jgi:hypothetical protein